VPRFLEKFKGFVGLEFHPKGGKEAMICEKPLVWDLKIAHARLIGNPLLPTLAEGHLF